MKHLYFITSNKGKVTEVNHRLSTFGYEVIQKNFGYPEIQASTLEEVILFGVRHVQKRVNHPFIIEDAGLFIDVLNGFPGVYSSYVFFSIGLQGILQLLTNVEETQRTASFQSVFAYKEPQGNPHIVKGECKGIISYEEKGTHGFGYDPIFIPNGDTRTFAQMETEDKNRISHRGKSLHRLVEFLQKK